MSDILTTVDAYPAAWKETDAACRSEQVTRASATDRGYPGPRLQAAGHVDMADKVAAVHAQYRGHRFPRTRAIDAHRDQGRFAWELAAPDGAVTVAGTDVGVAADGRGERIVGFFDELPEEIAA
jgi:hypothetical protein